jgi:ribonuclease R
MGFGFVAADDGGRDLYVHESNQGGAFHGDRVRASIIGVQEDGRREGRIDEILERSSRPILGVLRGGGGGDATVTPFDEGHGFLVEVERRLVKGAGDGDAVGVQLLRGPRGRRPAEGRVVEVLGRLDEPGVDVEVLIRKYGFETEFPEEVEREAAAFPARIGEAEREGRRDFRDEPVVTIDGESAQDFDDGILVRPRREGGWTLAVHIADVSHYVRPGSALDGEARRRGTSVYFPGRCIPMLPERLSNGLCSLRPEEDRLVQSVILQVAPDGRVTSSAFHDGVIRSRARLTYAEVAAAVGGREAGAREARAELLPVLGAAAGCAAALRERRLARGALDFDLPAPEILLDLRGATTDIVTRPRNLAHRMIEEFMLAANQAVAAWLVRRRVPTLFRVHERPDLDRLKALDEVLEGFGMRLPRPLESIAPQHLQEVLEWLEGRPEELFLTRRVLRAMALARYADECLGHFGLATPRYLHFTSPIRRYPDLVAHRSLRAARRGIELPGGEGESLDELATACSRLERDAEAAERESVEMKTLAFLAERLGDSFGGVVTEVVPFGLFVELEGVMVEGLLHVSQLGEGYFRLDRRRHRLAVEGGGPSYGIGDRLEVRVERVDPFLRRVDLGLEGATPARRGRSGAPGAHRGRRKSSPEGTRAERRGRARRKKEAEERRASKRRRKKG